MRTVLVTGGAKRLGATIAQRLAAEGHRVVVHYGGSGEAARALAAAIGGVAVQADLAEPAAVDRLIDDARAAAGAPIDGLVNSASQFAFDAAPDVDRGLAERLHAVNLLAPVMLASALARQPDVTRGAVVNLLDQKIGNLNPDFFSYTLTKIALAGATTTLAQALGPRIAVNAVAPGLSLPSGDQTEAEFRAVASTNLRQRPVDPDEVARAVAFLIGARGLHGQTVFVDNGQRFLPRARDVMFERTRG